MKPINAKLTRNGMDSAKDAIVNQFVCFKWHGMPLLKTPQEWNLTMVEHQQQLINTLLKMYLSFETFLRIKINWRKFVVRHTQCHCSSSSTAHKSHEWNRKQSPVIKLRHIAAAVITAMAVTVTVAYWQWKIFGIVSVWLLLSSVFCRLWCCL